MRTDPVRPAQIVIMARGRFILALAVLAVPAWSAGQVRILQEGRALDANPYIGSGGYNSAYPSGFLDTQLIVNRQVTGLAGFRGQVSYYPVDQLSLSLPTDALETFRRQSVGAQDVLRGQTYAPVPYYDPARTIVGLRSIAAGQVIPGSPIPRTLPPAGLFGQGGTMAYTPLALTPSTGLMGLRARPTEGSFLRFDVGDLVAADRSAGTNLFAVPDAGQRERLARELNQVEMPAELVVRSELDARMEPSAAPVQRRPIGSPLGQIEPNEPNGAARPTPAGQVPYLRSETSPLAPDQDVFSDVLLRLQGGTLGPAGAVPSSAQPAGGEEQPAGPLSAAERIQARQPELRTHPAAAGEERPALKPARGTLVEYSPRSGLVLRGLAGTGRDEFNTTMAQAQRDLKDGRYYDAADSYRRAASLQPDNPLPQVGLSLALFGTAESLGAARHLRQGAVIFPRILTSRLDIAGMTNAETMKRRLDFLAIRLENTPSGDPLLYFIGAYVHANLGQADQARDYALKLQATAADDAILADYARFLLTGPATSGPGSQPASQPASASTAR